MKNPVQALDDARRAGIDLESLDFNLSLSHEERWRQHHEVSGLMLKLREIGIITDKDLLTAKQVLALATQHSVV